MTRPVRVLIVGGAGFIGSHLTDVLVRRGDAVTVYDDFSAGKESFLAHAKSSGKLDVVRGDARDADALTRAMQGVDAVVHLAANPEARRGLEDDRVDVALGLETTLEVLSSMRRAGVERLVFASSGTVYGDRSEPAAERDLGSLPVSLYGASKLASEAFISAHVSCFARRAVIFRFGNVVGPRATHGVIKDFIDRLVADPRRLEVLGDGSQSKPYLHVSECVRGIAHGLDRVLGPDEREEPLDVWNLAPRDQTSVRDIARWVVAQSSDPTARISFGERARGWRGDVPVSRLVPDALARAGFVIDTPSDDAVRRAIAEIWSERRRA